IDDGGGGVEAWVGNAPDADFAIVAGHVLEEELDRIVGVGGVVHVLRRLLVIDVGAHLLEIPLAHPTAAHILVDKDVAAFLELLGGAEVGGKLVFTVGSHAVGRAVHQERIGSAGGLLGDIHGGEEMFPIAHGDAVLVLGVVR